jgi:hypothetical protein
MFGLDGGCTHLYHIRHKHGRLALMAWGGVQAKRKPKMWFESRSWVVVWFSGIAGALLSAHAADQSRQGKSPLDELPVYIRQVTQFGERADWSHDGKRILFLEKTFGDVYEVDLKTKTIRPMTHHYFHCGYTRALYLANGDILLSGARDFDVNDPWAGRGEKNAELWVLKGDLSGPAAPLGERCSEGPAVSRKHNRIAWTQRGAFYMADVTYNDGKPALADKMKILDKKDLPFECDIETQNFRPPDESELIFSAYGYQGTEVMGLDIKTGKVVNYSNAPGQYDEPEGIFPDGKYTLVECDKHCLKGTQYIDIYKLSLDGSGKTERLTHFADYPGYKASNPVVSDDGRYMAFQMARLGDAAGVGRGILVFDLQLYEQKKDRGPEIEAKVEQIKNHFGVQVHYRYDANAFFPESWKQTPISGRGAQMPLGEVDRVLAAIEKFLGEYPLEVLHKNLTDIYLVNGLEFYGKGFGGAYSTSALYINNEGQTKGYAEEFLLSTMHSEFSSILMRNYRQQFPGRVWSTLNPDGFSYGGTGVEMLGHGDIFQQTQELLRDGFLFKYSQSSLENDFNMFAFWAFTKPGELQDIAVKYEKINKKYELMTEFYRRIDPRICVGLASRSATDVQLAGADGGSENETGK